MSTSVTAVSRAVSPEKLDHAAPVLCRRVSWITPGISGADSPSARCETVHHLSSWSAAIKTIRMITAGMGCFSFSIEFS